MRDQRVRRKKTREGSWLEGQFKEETSRSRCWSIISFGPEDQLTTICHVEVS